MLPSEKKLWMMTWYFPSCTLVPAGIAPGGNEGALEESKPTGTGGKICPTPCCSGIRFCLDCCIFCKEKKNLLVAFFVTWEKKKTGFLWLGWNISYIDVCPPCAHLSSHQEVLKWHSFSYNKEIWTNKLQTLYHFDFVLFGSLFFHAKVWSHNESRLWRYNGVLL